MTDIVKTYIAGADIAEHTPVKFNANGQVVAVNAATDKCIGVTEHAVKSGTRVDVKHLGIGFVQVDSASAGEFLIPKNNGKAQEFSLSAIGEITEHTAIYTIGIALDSDNSAYYAKTLINPAMIIVPYIEEVQTK